MVNKARSRIIIGIIGIIGTQRLREYNSLQLFGFEERRLATPKFHDELRNEDYEDDNEGVEEMLGEARTRLSLPRCPLTYNHLLHQSLDVLQLLGLQVYPVVHVLHHT
jgi:hypothetical protein